LNLPAHAQREATARACRFVSITSPAPRDVWRKLIRQDVDAVPYQSPEWVESACATGRYVDASRLYETEDGEQFVVPLLKRGGLPDWLNIAASMPESWGIGGPLGSVPLTPTAGRRSSTVAASPGGGGGAARPGARRRGLCGRRVEMMGHRLGPPGTAGRGAGEGG